MKKRYEYWGMIDGKPVKMWTEWFPWDSSLRDEWQLKSKLRNEYNIDA